ETRFRALPPPPLPDGLEERLLAAIPAALPKRHRSPWLLRIGAMAVAACLLVAACLWALGVFAPPGRHGIKPAWVNEPSATATDIELEFDPLGQIARVGAHELRQPFKWPIQDSIVAHPRDGVIDALLD